MAAPVNADSNPAHGGAAAAPGGLQPHQVMQPPLHQGPPPQVRLKEPQRRRGIVKFFSQSGSLRLHLSLASRLGFADGDSDLPLQTVSRASGSSSTTTRRRSEVRKVRLALGESGLGRRVHC